MEIPLENYLNVLYPTFELDSDRGILPNVHLPMNFKELIPKFYKQNGRQEIEDFAKGLGKIFQEASDIRLSWDEEIGLKNISLGIHPGFDLKTSGLPHFIEHNLGNYYAFIAGAIAQKYVSELLRPEEIKFFS